MILTEQRSQGCIVAYCRIVWMFSTFGVRCGEFFHLSGKTGNPTEHALPWSQDGPTSLAKLWRYEDKKCMAADFRIRKEEKGKKGKLKVGGRWKWESDEKDETFQELSPSRVCVTPHVAPSAASPRSGCIIRQQIPQRFSGSSSSATQMPTQKRPNTFL